MKLTWKFAGGALDGEVHASQAAGGTYFVHPIMPALLPLHVVSRGAYSSLPVEIRRERYRREMIWKQDVRQSHGFAVDEEGNRIVDHVLWIYDGLEAQ